MAEEKASWGSSTTEEAPEYGSLIPEGTYECWVEKAEAKISNSSGNKYYSMQFRVDGGPHNKRVFFHAVHLQNKNQKWLQQQFNALKRMQMIAGLDTPNIPTPTEMQDFVGKRFSVKLKVEKGSNGYEDSNKIVDTYPSENKENVAIEGEIVDEMDDDVPF